MARTGPIRHPIGADRSPGGGHAVLAKQVNPVQGFMANAEQHIHYRVAPTEADHPEIIAPVPVRREISWVPHAPRAVRKGRWWDRDGDPS